MAHTPFQVLFLCTGNSARSIMAEAILNRIGLGRFHARSAGSHPAGAVNPHALELLDRLDYPTVGLRSKSWDEFAGPGGPSFDFIITVCDRAAGEVCPVWPGRPTRMHWSIPDPAAAAGSEAEIALAFAGAFRMLKRRIDLLTSLPAGKLDAAALKDRFAEIDSVQAS